MKKLFSIITLVMLLLGCLALPAVAAKDPSYTYHDYADFDPEEIPDTFLSEDMQVLTLKGETYHRMNLSGFELSLENYGKLPLSEDQKGQIANNTVWWDGYRITAQVALEYVDGTEITMYFVNDHRRSAVEALASGEDIEGRVEFYWPEDHTVIAPLSDFKGTPKPISYGDLSGYNIFEVYGHVEGLNLQYRKGLVLENRGIVYYLDFAENGIDPNTYYEYEYSTKQVYEITDEALKAELSKYIGEYYDDGVGMFYDEAFTEKLSAGVLIVLFAGVPAAILIWAVVLLIKSKGYQRKSWIVTAGLSGCTVVVFTIVTVLIMRI